MKLYKEMSLRDFEAWSGAEDTMETLSMLEDNEDKGRDIFDTLECILEEQYFDGLEETELNDILWFETDYIAECLGYSDWDELEKIANGEDEDDIFNREFEDGEIVFFENYMDGLGMKWVVEYFDSSDGTYKIHPFGNDKIWKWAEENELEYWNEDKEKEEEEE